MKLDAPASPGRGKSTGVLGREIETGARSVVAVSKVYRCSPAGPTPAARVSVPLGEHRAHRPEKNQRSRLTALGCGAGTRRLIGCFATSVDRSLYLRKVVREARDTRCSSALDFTYVTAHILEIWRPSRSSGASTRRSGGVHTNSRASYSCEHYRRDTTPLRQKRDSRERKRSCRSEKGSTEPSPSKNGVQECHPRESSLCPRDTPWRS